MMVFVHWVAEQGTRKRLASVIQAWQDLKMLYTRVTGNGMDKNISKEVAKVWTILRHYLYSLNNSLSSTSVAR
jgi:hypothetical protein